MTLPEQAGSVAKAAIEGMKSNPNCLAALIVLSIIAVFAYFSQERQASQWNMQFEATQELLARCYLEQSGGPTTR
jgi:hypothetical protein